MPATTAVLVHDPASWHHPYSQFTRRCEVRGPRLTGRDPDRTATYKCEGCGAEEIVMNERGLVEEPTRCGQCSKKWTQRLLHNRSSFYDKQILKMQVGVPAMPP